MRAVALTAILALVPSAASPCSIKRDTVDSIFSGSTGVPLNAEINYLSTSQTTWSWTDDSGAVVPERQRRRTDDSPGLPWYPVTPKGPC